jgi:transposase
MTSYQNFFGIDIGKFTFVVSLHGKKTTHDYENTPQGIAQFMKEHQAVLPYSLCVAETTGGYELPLLHSLIERGYAVHRADTRKVKNFIRSFGHAAKTDALDAKALALYAYERWEKLDLFHPLTSQATLLSRLVQRRMDLKHMLVAEKNRLKGPSSEGVQDSIRDVITMLSTHLDTITQQIQEMIKASPLLMDKLKILKTIPGIGDVIASELLVLFPELGTLCRKKIAALAGLAPRCNDSGRFCGYRKTGKGRNGIKPLLFLAAMAARNSNSFLKAFYEKLIAAGKRKMVALTALMRKILVIANAKLKPFSYSSQHS